MIILYSTGCPRCEVIEEKLNSKNIPFTIESDIAKMRSLGILSVPVLEVEGKKLSFSQANDWVNEQEAR